MNEKMKREWENFVHNLKWLRTQHGLSKKEMAKRLNISVWMLNKIERGEQPPRLTIDIFFAVQDQFGLHPAEQFAHRLGK